MPRRAKKTARITSVSTNLSSLRSRLRHVVLRQSALIVRRSLKHDRGVLSTGFGYKSVGGKLSGELSVRIYVRKKLLRVTSTRAIPKVIRVRVQVEGIRYSLRLPTDIIESPDLFRARPQALQAPRVFNDNDQDEYGTATAIVTNGAQEYLLSAAHVVGRVLKVPSANPGELVSDGQPDRVGSIFFVPSVVKTALDAALVVPIGDRRIDVPRPGRTPVATVCPVKDLLTNGPDAAYRVLAYRRLRTATFHAVIPNYTVNGVYAEGPVTFAQVLEFEVTTEGGDSGAMVIDAAGRGVGLHILAVSSDKDWAYSMPIADVLDKLLVNSRLRLVF